MRISSEMAGSRRRPRIKIVKPCRQNDVSDAVWKEVQQYAQMIPYELEPNMGRVDEIREEIRKGTYLQKEMIDEAAAKIASRFLKKD